MLGVEGQLWQPQVKVPQTESTASKGKGVQRGERVYKGR